MSNTEKMYAKGLALVFVLVLLYVQMRRHVVMLATFQAMNAGGVYEPGLLVNAAPHGQSSFPAPSISQGIGGAYGIVSQDEMAAPVRQYDSDPSNRGMPAEAYYESKRGFIPPSNPLSVATETLQMLNDQAFVQQVQQGY